MEVALTDRLTISSGFSFGDLEGLRVAGDSIWSRASNEELTGVEITSFNGISIGGKYRLIDTRDDLSLSIYASYEKMNFDTPSKYFESESQEITAGLITGYQIDKPTFIAPSLALFYTGTFNEARSSFGNIPHDREIYCVGTEANLLFQASRVFLLAGLGAQQRLGEMRDFGNMDVYSYVKIGIDVLSGFKREFADKESKEN